MLVNSMSWVVLRLRVMVVVDRDWVRMFLLMVVSLVVGIMEVVIVIWWSLFLLLCWILMWVCILLWFGVVFGKICSCVIRRVMNFYLLVFVILFCKDLGVKFFWKFMFLILILKIGLCLLIIICDNICKFWFCF